MTAQGIASFFVFLGHVLVTVGVIDVVWGAGVGTFNALAATYLASVGGLFSWALIYQFMSSRMAIDE